jgi:prepilin-type N-terminal cleavage/methylation domain-containing protein
MFCCPNLKISKHKNKAGFTLTELLTVAGLIAVLTAIFFVNYRNANQQFAVSRSAQKLAQDIRRAEEMSISAKDCCGGIVPPGYGVWLEQGNSYYIIYADTQPPSGNGFYSTSDTVIETNQLESGVTIQSVGTANGKVGINFAPPSPTIKIKYQDSGEQSSTTITLAGGGTTKTVKVNNAGLINVE